MAEFCAQCTVEFLDIAASENDFVGIQTPKDTENELYTPVLCEGCGPTQVDDLGNCIFHNEPNHGKEPPIIAAAKEATKELKSS